MDGRANRRYKAACLNFSGMVWTQPKKVMVKIRRIKTYSEMLLIQLRLATKIWLHLLDGQGAIFMGVL